MAEIDPNAIVVEKVVSEGLRKYIVTVKKNVADAKVHLAIGPEEGKAVAMSDWNVCKWSEWRDNCSPHG